MPKFVSKLKPKFPLNVVPSSTALAYSRPLRLAVSWKFGKPMTKPISSPVCVGSSDGTPSVRSNPTFSTGLIAALTPPEVLTCKKASSPRSNVKVSDNDGSGIASSKWPLVSEST